MVDRTEILHALDELVNYEEGPRFQALAVVLAKLKWPTLIACEGKSDLGLDAYEVAPDSGLVVRGLACSLTATKGKALGDAESARSNHPHLRSLIFATPRTVTEKRIQDWRNAARKDHGIELVVLQQEEYVCELLKPENIPLCRNHLRIDSDETPKSIELLIERIREAASEVVDDWLKRAKLSGRSLIDLRARVLDADGSVTAESVGLGGFSERLSKGARILIEAPAGRGKTTTLLQLCQGQAPFSVEIEHRLG